MPTALPVRPDTSPDYLSDAASNTDLAGHPLIVKYETPPPEVADPAATGIPFYRPVLRAGNGGYGVHALQLEMHSQLGTHATNTKSGAYDNPTKVDVQAFYVSHNHVESADLWDFWGWDTVAPQVIHQPAVLTLLAEAYAYAHPPAPVTNLRARVVQAALFGYDHRLNIHYAQVRPYPSSLALAVHQIIYTDCSGFDIDCYRMAGAPDPNGTNYNGSGFTGTLFNRGHAVTLAQLQPGDLTFYGDQGGGVPSHTAVYIGGGMVVSNGRYPMDKTGTLLGGALSWRGGRSYL